MLNEKLEVIASTADTEQNIVFAILFVADFLIAGRLLARSAVSGLQVGQEETYLTCECGQFILMIVRTHANTLARI